MIKKLLLVALFVFVILCGINFLVPETQAQTVPNVPVGWGWSSNIGWIKLAGSWTDPIKVDPAGSVTGFGWSPHIGWVSFYGARYVNGELHGGGRACTSQADKANCTGGSAPNAGGWDGLISLFPASGSQYGVKLAGSQLAGFGWGSDVVGWTYFNIPPPGSFSCPAGQHEDPVGSHTCVDDPPACSGNPPFSNCTCPNGSVPDINGQCGGGNVCPADSDGIYPTCVCKLGTTGTPGSCVTQTYQCNDGIDNPDPEDTLIDMNDPGCDSPTDPDETDAPPSLDVTPGNELLVIRNQASGQPANSVIKNPPAGSSNPSGTLAAELTAKNGSITACIQSVKMQKSPNKNLGPDLNSSVQLPTCQFQKGYSATTPFGSCANTCLNLSAGEKAYFRIKVQRPLKVIADNNPYQIIIGDNASGNNATSKKLILDYLVGTFDPI